MQIATPITIDISDVIQIIGICVALLTGIISIIISIITLCQNSKIVKESNMAQIEVFPFKVYGDFVPRIKIQNFGHTTGTIIDVKVTPEMPNDIVTNPFIFYYGLSLAPNQSFTTVFCKNNSSDVPVEEFDVKIKYKTLNKIIESKYHINYKFLDGALETKPSPDDAINALNNINQSIQGLQQI